MFYKTSLNDETFKDSEFMRKKFDKGIPESCIDKGINTNKLNKIKNDLLPHMPARKRIFWNELPVCNSSKDMCTSSEV